MSAVLVKPEVLSGKVFIVVTGASQGIGRQIAATFSEFLDKESQVLLLARNEDGLKETLSQSSKNISVEYASVDLSLATAQQLTDIIKKVIGSKKFERAVLIQNAGSLGDISINTAEMMDMEYWKNYYALNVFSPAILNSVFVKLFGDEETKKLVINITSLAAIQPIKSMGYYGSGKAAREMYFKIFAEEFPSINVLNYSPGPVDTDMQTTIVTSSGDDETRQTMIQLREQKKALTTKQTIDRLVNILANQQYKSGDHIDFYDNRTHI